MNKPVCKLIDFGMAKGTRDAETGEPLMSDGMMTDTDKVMRTPEYMSPEMWRGTEKEVRLLAFPGSLERSWMPRDESVTKSSLVCLVRFVAVFVALRAAGVALRRSTGALTSGQSASASSNC